MPTKIPWTEESWNPVVGCSKCSPGCKNCYAEKMAIRLNGMAAARGNNDLWASMSNILKWTEPSEEYEFGKAIGWNGDVELFYSRLDKPLHWFKPRKIFVCSMSDLFHPRVPFDFIDMIFGTICITQQHTYQILSKRANRMLEYMRREDGGLSINREALHEKMIRLKRKWKREVALEHPLPNIHMGVSVSTQKEADEKTPILLQIPAAVRFVSIEPMLEEVDIYDSLIPIHLPDGKLTDDKYTEESLDWVIIGAESINGHPGRECKLEWVKSLVEQCDAAGVPIFVKQLHIDGKLYKYPRDIDKFSKWARRQEYPE